MLLRLAPELPVAEPAAHQRDDAQRHPDQGIPVARAGLQQADAITTVLRQAIGQHAAGGTGADHHEIIRLDLRHGVQATWFTRKEPSTVSLSAPSAGAGP